MNIELSWQKKNYSLQKNQLSKDTFFTSPTGAGKAISTWPCEPRVSLAICWAEATLSFISRYLLAHVQQPFPLTHRLVN